MKVSNEFKIGVLALVSGLLLYFGVRFLKGTDVFSRQTTYYAVYDSVDGLTISNPILLNGYSVGRVNDVKLLQEGTNNRVVVELDIESTIKVGQGAVAQLVSSDILGGKAIALKTGDVNKPLNARDTLLSETDKGIQQLMMDTALPVIKQLDSAMIRINYILKNIDENESTINQTLANISVLTKTLNGTVVQNQKNISTSTTNLAKLTEGLTDDNEGLVSFLSKMNHLADSLNDLPLKATLEETKATMANIKLLSDQIEAGKGTMGKMMKDDSLYNNLNASAQSLDLLLNDLRERPRRYVHFSLFGRKNKD
ncbi:MAG: MlaD family protein [Cyclobacteriaceae bacterium]|nr:MCE family protein [Cyclobacteriaceae bacterium]MCH8514746.1 MlaD family protein [Cyclobacteriaceae bacterium]